MRQRTVAALATGWFGWDLFSWPLTGHAEALQEGVRTQVEVMAGIHACKVVDKEFRYSHLPPFCDPLPPAGFKCGQLQEALALDNTPIHCGDVHGSGVVLAV